MNVPGSFGAVNIEKDRGGFLFQLLSFYLFLLFFRPFDQLTALQVLHLPMVVGGLCTVAYAAHRLSTGQSVVPLSSITNGLFFISVWMLITIPFSFWISGSLHTFWDAWVKMIILYVLLSNIPQSGRQIRIAIWVCILGATGISVMAVARKVLLGESIAEGRLVTDASGLYSGPNFFAMTLMLLLPYVLFTFLLHRRMLVRLFAGFAVITFTLAIMMTESRAGVLAEISIVLLVFWKVRAWGVSLVKTLGVLFLGTVLILPLAPKGLWERFSLLFSDADINTLDPNSAAGSALASKEERKQLLIRAVILTAEHPIFGVGMNNFPAAAHERFNTGDQWLGCHDTFLQISAELGIPGLLLYVFLLYVTFKTLRQLRQRLGTGKTALPDLAEMRLFSEATMVAFWGFVLFSTVAHLGYQPYFFIIAAFGQSLSNLSSRAEVRAAPNAALTPVAAA